MIPDEKSHDLGTRRRIMQKTKWPIFLTILGVRIPVVQKPFQTKNATFILARIFSQKKEVACEYEYALGRTRTRIIHFSRDGIHLLLHGGRLHKGAATLSFSKASSSLL